MPTLRDFWGRCTIHTPFAASTFRYAQKENRMKKSNFSEIIIFYKKKSPQDHYLFDEKARTTQKNFPIVLDLETLIRAVQANRCFD